MNSYERIAAARILSGLTNDDLANRLGIARVNVIRWQIDTNLPKRHRPLLAEITGFPEGWLSDGGELEGFIIARPLRLTSNAPVNAVNRIKKHVSNILPALCKESHCVELNAPSGSAYVFSAANYCLLVITPHGLDINIGQLCTKTITAPDNTMAAAYSGTSSTAIKELLILSKNNAWADKVPQIDQVSVSGSYVLEINFQDSKQERLVMDEIKQLVHTLRLQGCGVNYRSSTGNTSRLK